MHVRPRATRRQTAVRLKFCRSFTRQVMVRSCPGCTRAGRRRPHGPHLDRRLL